MSEPINECSANSTQEQAEVTEHQSITSHYSESKITPVAYQTTNDKP